MALCPYCNKRPKLKKTCGHPDCQHKHYIAMRRQYFERFERKTDRRVSPSILRIRQQGQEVAAR